MAFTVLPLDSLHETWYHGLNLRIYYNLLFVCRNIKFHFNVLRAVAQVGCRFTSTKSIAVVQVRNVISSKLGTGIPLYLTWGLSR